MPSSTPRKRSMADAVKTEQSRWMWPFELLERIGEGGMGHVYRARYVPRNLEVAVKMMPEDVSDGTTLARFEREMEVLKELKHPNIVRTFGGVSETKQRFYAMELMPGGTIEDELQKKGRLSWELVIEYGLQMCAALEYLHSKGVVHRDVKPSNFLKGNDGRIKLSDFGLASIEATRKITAEGRTAGTFLYMAPEQIRGETVVPQTDLYALGCVLFELLTGKPPLVGETPAATLHKHCKQTPARVTEYAMDCPLSLERIVARLLEKSTDQRPRSAAEVARELRSVSQTVEVVPGRPRDLTLRGGNRLVEARDDATESQTEVTIKAVPSETHLPRRWIVGAAGVAAILVGWIIALYSSLSTGTKAVTLWREALEAPKSEVRSGAAEALAQLQDEEGLKLVAEKLRTDPDLGVRAACATSLGQAGEAGRPHLPTLIRARNEDEHQDVRIAADQAIKRLQED